MRILFIVPNPPSLIRVRPYHFIRQLVQRGHQVIVATVWTNQEEQADIQHLSEELALQVLSAYLPLWRSLWNCLQALPSGLPLQAAYAWHPLLAQACKEQHERLPFDIIHVEHLRGACYALFLQSLDSQKDNPTPIVWDSVDCISHLFAEAAQTSRSLKGRLMGQVDAHRTRRHEGWLVQQFSHVLVTSPTDKAALLRLAKLTDAPHLSVLPNGVDLAYFSPPNPNEPREAATLVMSGKMSYHANVTAALHLLEDIMPLIWNERPDIQVQIVGKNPPPTLQALSTEKGTATSKRVTVTGSVPHFPPYLRRATISVVPLLYGAGIQNKVLEAMACATPVVSSSLAVRGLADKSSIGRDILVADKPKAFARTVLELLDNPTKRAALGNGGRRYVERYHAWDTIGAQLEEIYEKAKRDVVRYS